MLVSAKWMEQTSVKRLGRWLLVPRSGKALGHWLLVKVKVPLLEGAYNHGCKHYHHLTNIIIATVISKSATE